MSLFKKKIKLVPFLKEMIVGQCAIWEKYCPTWIDMADEAHVLTDTEKRELSERIHDLVIADIVLNCHNYLAHNLTLDEMTVFAGTVYELYLMDKKELSRAAAEQETRRVRELLSLLSWAETRTQEHDEYRKRIGYEPPYRAMQDLDKARLHLCQAFCKHCVGEVDMRSRSHVDRHFAVFKLAKALVQGNAVGQALKKYSVTF